MHPLVLALFDDPVAAASAARDLRGLGISRERVSVVARSHDEEGALAEASGASPGSEIEDSRAASRRLPRRANSTNAATWSVETAGTSDIGGPKQRGVV